MINLEVDVAQLDRIAGAIGGTPKEITRAFNTTVLETVRPLRREGLRRMQSRLGLRNQKSLARRFKVSIRRGESGRRLWIGLNALNARAWVPAGRARGQYGRRRYAQVQPHTRRGGDVRGFRRRYQAGVNAGGIAFPKGFWISVSAGLVVVERRGGRPPSPIRIPINHDGRQVAEELFASLPETFYPRFQHNLERTVMTRNG